jgi:RNA polymerase sigma factor (sigma-70 family)|tara:strand:+ start:999 stop:1583 length:585 start_codon:yes stop_codon:yes gene_type:complete
MEITDELITQWEPKVQRFLNTSYVLGMDREDLGQELRIAIVKAAEGFDGSRGISFHTYLHTTMVNTLRTLISKAQKQHVIHEATSLDSSPAMDLGLDESNIGHTSAKILKALEDPITKYKEQEFEVQDLLIRSQLNNSEINFINLRIEGLTMEEITLELGESSYKLRHSSKKKLGKYITNINWLEDDDAGKETG